MGYAYAKMLIENKHNGNTYNLVGEAITQTELTNYINKVFDTKLVFNPVSEKDYLEERKAALGDFIGTVIGGIYQGIKEGANDVASDFEKATGRKHATPLDMMENFKLNTN